MFISDTTVKDRQCPYPKLVQYFNTT